jgi:hypothetical protein
VFLVAGTGFRPCGIGRFLSLSSEKLSFSSFRRSTENVKLLRFIFTKFIN